MTQGMSMVDAHLEGVAQGREQALAEVEAFIDALIAAIPNLEAVPHHHRCYVKHPRCAALAVARHVREMRGQARTEARGQAEEWRAKWSLAVAEKVAVEADLAACREEAHRMIEAERAGRG